MYYFSTNQKSKKVNFREATIKGQAPDKGLYFPDHIPVLSKKFIEDIQSCTREEIALTVIKPFVGDTIPEEELEKIVSETINFDFPLVTVSKDIFALELFHGPTLAFKDVGARFMSRCLRYFVKNHNRKITVLVATSGDTGSAVANGFSGVDGVEVAILYPSGKVSKVQELQLTRVAKNITVFEVEGNFDDCQRMVKECFADKDLNQKLFLTSANSINVARWLPQQFYYFFAYQQWKDKQAPIISVPSGNFGNLCAGVVAYFSGLPVAHFIAACNANDTVPEYLNTGIFLPKNSIHTISNAMDVGNPSNFPRLLNLFKNQYPHLKKMVSAYSFSDAETKNAIRQVYQSNGYLLDPHGAVGYLGLKKYFGEHIDQKGIFLSTAHPLKFYDVVEKLIPHKMELPAMIRDLMCKEKKLIKIKADSGLLKDFLCSTSTS
jgi:threonine synthase